MPTDPTLTPALLLQAYEIGLFPMSEGQDDPEIFWVDPRMRGIFPLDAFHISRSLARQIRRNTYQVTFDRAFPEVIQACADRDVTWINDTIFQLYKALFAQGHAHSIEIWDGKALIGGVYGVAIGAAFFGESMFSRRANASKIALAYLVDHLKRGGYQLFDTQFITPHLASLGAVEITREEYQRRLAVAVGADAAFPTSTIVTDPYSILQRSAQTS